MAAAVVELADLARRRPAVLEQLAGRPVQRLAEHLRAGCRSCSASISSDTASARNSPSESQRRWFSFSELLDVLRRRAAGAGLEQAAAVHQRDDREHLRARAELEDREQVGEVVAQDVAGDRDRVLAALGALEREAGRLGDGQDLDLQAVGVELVERRARPS